MIKNSAEENAAPESTQPTLDTWTWIARARAAASRVTGPDAPATHAKRHVKRKRPAAKPDAAAD